MNNIVEEKALKTYIDKDYKDICMRKDLYKEKLQEIDRLNNIIKQKDNIINSLEEYLEWSIGIDMYRLDFKIILDKLKELKENNNDKIEM